MKSAVASIWLTWLLIWLSESDIRPWLLMAACELVRRAGLWCSRMVCVFQLPSPARHWLHGSFQRTPERNQDVHWPHHHEDQAHEGGAKRDQEDSLEDTLHREGCIQHHQLEQGYSMRWTDYTLTFHWAATCTTLGTTSLWASSCSHSAGGDYGPCL